MLFYNDIINLLVLKTLNILGVCCFVYVLAYDSLYIYHHIHIQISILFVFSGSLYYFHDKLYHFLVSCLCYYHDISCHILSFLLYGLNNISFDILVYALLYPQHTVFLVLDGIVLFNDAFNFSIYSLSIFLASNTS